MSLNWRTGPVEVRLALSILPLSFSLKFYGERVDGG